ncbi:MAG: bifunctional phosphoribosylaminoimidazolecarboxamide formyltransferase/IMP cyclohydrolase [Chloroflexota bacterium]|nr:bifunctional phosphoribosylaminoimidazolecarboxamide formyltransferase/IMP cyclohydrolase [Chloroflexota bacterium]
MPRALLSVHDKTGLIDFAATLLDLGWDLVASGGTERALREAGLSVTSLEQVTGMPEMLDGRVKTLHPAIHAGILARDKDEDLQTLNEHGFAPINMVVCNLYPFQETVAKSGVSLQDAVEQIDVGGVTLLRGAAKNFFRVIAICNPDDYARVADALSIVGQVDIALRRELAVKAFAHTRDYDTAIHAFLSQDIAPINATGDLAEHISIGMQRHEILRYGENPHQNAAYYTRGASAGFLGGTLHGGKALSYNNILDLDAAWRAISSFSAPTVVIVKHLTPCGVATAQNIAVAFPAALESDPVSAFGGVIAVNRPVDDAFVAALGSLFIEAIAAPSFSASALTALTAKRENCRVLQIPSSYDGRDLEIRSVFRGFLVQQLDLGDPEMLTFRTVTQRQPTPEEVEALQFAWKVVQHVKSNAIVLSTSHITVGIGGGLPSRVDAVKLAVAKAGEKATGAVMASDAFFPFPDGIETAAAAGVTAVIQPGGSIRDSKVIEAANAANMAMIFTGIRHFRH